MELASSPPPLPRVEEDNLSAETPSEPPLEVDVDQAIRKFRGLGPAYWHHQSTKDGREAHGAGDGKLDHAQRYLEEQQALLEEHRQSLSREQWRMKVLEDNRAQVSEKVKALSQRLEEEKAAAVGAPRHVDEEVIALNKAMALTVEEMSRQQDRIYEVNSQITACENEILRAAFNARHVKPPPPVDPAIEDIQTQEEALIAAMRAEGETQAAIALEAMEKERAEAQHAKDQAFHEKMVKQIRVTAETHPKAIQRIMETAGERKHWTKIMVEKEKEKHEARIEAVLELKANTDKVTAEIRGENERANRIKQAKQRQLERTKDALLAAGKNPYVVMKQKELDRAFAREKAAREQQVVERQEALATKIMKDIEYERKEEEKTALLKEYEKKARDELGRHVIEARNRRYMLARTSKHVDIIDPTGTTMRVDPSQVTTIVDRAFGLGFNPRKDRNQMAQVLDLIQSNPNYQDAGYGEYTRMLPKTKTSKKASAGGSNKSSSSNQEASDQQGANSNNNLAWLDDFLPPEMEVPGKDLVMEDEIDDNFFDDENEESPSSDNTSKDPLQLRSLSKFEQDCLEKAQKLQKERLLQGVPQVVNGRTWEGPAFVARPAVIDFKDFVVGKAYRKKIILTNVSLSFNRFKLMDLPEDIRDFFDITYDRPGRMSPGMVCVLDILFTPTANRDINASLRLLSQTGPIDLPLTCTYPKVVPSISTSHVAFHDVVRGEKQTVLIHLRNNGALPTKYEIFDAEEELRKRFAQEKEEEGEDPDASLAAGGDSATEVTEASLLSTATEKSMEWLEEAKQGGGIFRFKDKGEVGPHSEVTHAITFAPLEVGSFDITRTIRFTGHEGTFVLDIEGHSLEVPIYVEGPLVDMQCCVYGKLYRKDIILQNRGKISYKMQSFIPPELKGCIELSPDYGFIQPGVDFLLRMKFRPNADLATTCGQYAMQNKDGSHTIAVPVQVLVPNQVVPVYFTLRSQLTHGTLTLSTDMIDFGPCCFTTEVYRSSMTITNNSHLAQKIGFVELPSVIEVRPNDGFKVLLPLESTTFDIFFKPASAIHYDRQLTLKTTMATTYKVRVVGQGVQPPVSLSHSVLKLAAACPGDIISQDFMVTNRTKKDQTIEFSIPAPLASYLSVAPVVAHLKPEASQRMTLWYSPSPDEDPEKDLESEGGSTIAEDSKSLESGLTNSVTSLSKTGKSSSHPPLPDLNPDEGKVEYSNEEGDKGFHLEGEPWSKHGHWKVRCFMKSPQPDGVTNDTQPAEDGAITTPPPPFVTLEVHTCVIERLLSIDPNVLDFGQLAAGQRKVATVRIRNRSEHMADLKVVRGLNAVGAFSLHNAVRHVPPGGITTLLLEFLPTSHGHRSEVILFHSKKLGKSLYLKVLGEGVDTTLEMTPSHGQVDFGQVVEGRSAQQTITLTNTSPFALRYQLRPLTQPHANFNHTDPFQCIPVEAEIAAGKSHSVSLTFSPDHSRIWPYTQSLEVFVAGQAETRRLHLTGRCWRRQLYVAASDPIDDTPARIPLSQEDPLTLPTSLEPTEAQTATALGLTKKPSYDINLRFPQGQGEGTAAVRKLVIGSASLGPQGGATPGTFEVELGEEAKKAGYFTVSPDKGPVAPDSRTEVTFTYKPPPANTQGGLAVGQWIRYPVRVTLKGGYKATTAEQDVQAVPFILEAFVHV